MERQTVDFGIDLGTTNSVLARAMPEGIEIVRNTLESELTSSAVAVIGPGQILVGQDALDKPGFGGVTRFKRQMGTTNSFRMADGNQMTPEQLSAEVLKELMAGVQLRYDMRPEFVVVTVPAMFQQPQCEATHRAVELAGLQAVTLLQEPIAAATAYLNESKQEGNYLIYDLGGGTFDVSIVRLKDREMSVVAHGGDNFLGGSDFDRKIYEWVLEELARVHSPQSHLEKSPYREMLLRACEQARIRLSVKASVPIDLSDFDLPVKQIAFTKEKLETLIAEFAERTIHLTKERLEQASLQPRDVLNILLVGGPTRTPYIRRCLDEKLGIPRSHDLDPMTVVARGAAIYASAMLKPQQASSRGSSASNEVAVDLFYDSVSQDIETTVSGRVTFPMSFSGEIRLARASGDWDSGWISLKDHAFVCNVLLEQNGGTEFHISLRDSMGTLATPTPNALAIRYGNAAARPLTPYNYGVALADGRMQILIESCQPLPGYGNASLFAAKTVRAGAEDELTIYFLEGMSPVASENIQVGKLIVKGCDLTRTVKEGEKIEVRLYMDESRKLKAKVYVPVFDLDFAVEMHSMIDRPNSDALEASLNELGATLNELRVAVSDEDEATVSRAYTEKEKLEAVLERVERHETGEAERVTKKLADIKAEVRLLSEKYGPQAAHALTSERIDEAEKIALESEDIIGVATAGELRADADKCLNFRDTRGLEAVRERADKIYYKHYLQTETCWVSYIKYLRDNRQFATDRIQYHDCIQRAEECMQSKDYDGVRSFARTAMDFLPDDDSPKNRFYNAGLRQ